MIFGVVIGICVLGAGAIYADLQVGYYSAGNLGGIVQTTPPNPQPNGAYTVAAYPRYALTLAPGDGQQDVTAYCNTCHSPGYITMQPPLPAATWEAEVNKMVKTYGAEFPTDVQARITKYLQTNYTPETRKR
jgi:hypothetical protein